MHAEICYAECLLQKAALTFVQVMNIYLRTGIAGEACQYSREEMWLFLCQCFSSFDLELQWKIFVILINLGWKKESKELDFCANALRVCFKLQLLEPLPFKETILQVTQLTSGYFSVWKQLLSLCLLSLAEGCTQQQRRLPWPFPSFTRCFNKAQLCMHREPRFSRTLQILFFSLVLFSFPCLAFSSSCGWAFLKSH